MKTRFGARVEPRIVAISRVSTYEASVSVVQQSDERLSDSIWVMYEYNSLAVARGLLGECYECSKCFDPACLMQIAQSR